MDDSPLQRLAPELRNKIYELVLLERPLDPQTLDPQRPRAFIKTDGITARPHVPPNALALLGTCRQIQSEANKIFYSNHTFKIDTGGYGPPHGSRLTEDDILRLYLGRLRPESREALKHIEILSSGYSEYKQMLRFHHIGSYLKLDSFVCSFRHCHLYTKDGPIDILNVEKSRVELLESARLPRALDHYSKYGLANQVATLHGPEGPCHCRMLRMSAGVEQERQAVEAAAWPQWPTNSPWWVTCRVFRYGSNECARI